MAVTSDKLSTATKNPTSLWDKIRVPFSQISILGWLLGALVAALLEQFGGETLAQSLGMSKIPVLFGLTIILDYSLIFKQPFLLPGALLYVLLIYLVPVGTIARLSASSANRIAAKLHTWPLWFSALIHLGLFYAVLHIWTGVSDYRLLVVRLTLIAIMITLSLNIVNGYMGEFSCSHPGFMALGAYGTSVFTVGLFVDDPLLGPPWLSPTWGPVMFPVGLIVGGIVAALGAIIIAIPSFRTRGDYLAIISLAFMFIVKSLVENLEFVGGARGLGKQPNWANLPTVFIWTVLCIWIINNFVRSTLGKALNAVRDDEMAANAMTVNTRQTKMTAFLFAAFWAGVAGGLFAHVLGFINPDGFGIQKLAEVLAMVYLGGLNSVVGSIFGAVSLNLLIESLRPLQSYKWIIIPLLLILVMIFRPPGLLAFREFDVKKFLQPKQKKEVN